MIVTVKTTNGVEVFSFDQGRPDDHNIPLLDQVAEALRQAQAGVKAPAPETN